MPYVHSSAISQIEHDEASGNLYVTFHKSGAYTYYGVPRSVYLAFIAAASIGTFFADRIRDRYSVNR